MKLDALLANAQVVTSSAVNPRAEGPGESRRGPDHEADERDDKEIRPVQGSNLEYRDEECQREDGRKKPEQRLGGVPRRQTQACAAEGHRRNRTTTVRGFRGVRLVLPRKAGTAIQFQKRELVAGPVLRGRAW